MILPVAVACGGQSTDVAIDPAADTTAEMPATEAPATDSAAMGETIVDVAAANGSFNTLVAAVQSAGLAETLSSEGPYTVFAPTDDAFAALPAGTLDKLLLPENQEVLAQILSYHVVSGEVPSSDVETGMVETVEGSDLDVVANESGVTVNDAKVVQPDVVASNGVIHVIDSVLLPPSLDLSTL
ncbi:MAG: fasciclin [Phormidesmis priestleyi]|uniref:Fasciclin n=1 Tax=Phormidesmis priestleyi TaxID=268141 RepID=A0A2W4Z9B4_9CYAN|nr:MAG: fasciclin [Phormidesmis priestleyi]